jgi:hypothetical protein
MHLLKHVLFIALVAYVTVAVSQRVAPLRTGLGT